MKKSLVVLPFLLVLTISAGASELSLSAGFDWMLGIRGGFEYLFLPPVGMQAHAGVTIAQASTADLLLSVRVWKPTGRFSLRLLAGVPDALFPFGTGEFMVSLGGAVEGRWWVSKRIGLSLRAGEGYPLFFSNGRLTDKSIRYPLGLWPDLFLSLWYRL